MTVMLDYPPTLEHENLWKADGQWRSGHQPVRSGRGYLAKVVRRKSKQVSDA